MTQANDLERLRAALEADGADVLLLSPLPATRVHARFIGRFAGREVIWDMRLFTLERYEEERGSMADATLHGLMHIAPGNGDTYRLDVALKLPLLDEPALKKTMVMMRNYKRLRLGLRTWGPD